MGALSWRLDPKVRNRVEAGQRKPESRLGRLYPEDAFRRGATQWLRIGNGNDDPTWQADAQLLLFARLATLGEMGFLGQSKVCRWDDEREETTTRVAGAQLLSDLEIVGPVVHITKSSGTAFPRGLLGDVSVGIVGQVGPLAG